MTSQRENEPKKQILFAASVSLMNPHAILDTIGVIGTNSLQYAGGEKWVFTVCVILVSWLWLFGLALTRRPSGQRDPNGQFITKLNKISACMIWSVAVYMGMQFL